MNISPTLTTFLRTLNRVFLLTLFELIIKVLLSLPTESHLCRTSVLLANMSRVVMTLTQMTFKMYDLLSQSCT